MKLRPAAAPGPELRIQTVLTRRLDPSNSPVMLPKTVLYYGSKTGLPDPIALKAGPLTMRFEPLTGFIRYIRIGDHEIIRAVYAAVRDQNWGTVAPQLHNFRQQIDKESFRLEFDVKCEAEEIHYLWHGSITGDADGTVRYSFAGEARSEFFRNRIGICVLHPIVECAGQPCTVMHSDGTEEQGSFPKSIAPWQPFFDVKALNYTGAGGAA